MVKLKFYWIDVFAEKKFQGNQLAVFPESGTLRDDQMQIIAKEMGLSETTFITGYDKAESDEHAYRTRIFTAEEELPFAGHPTLGTAFLIRNLHGEDNVKLALKAGIISVNFVSNNGDVFGEMVQNDPSFGSLHNVAAISQIFNVDAEQIDGDLPIQTVSTGNPFIIVPFRKLKDLQEVQPDFRLMNEYLGRSDARFFYLVCSETVNKEAIMHARMLFYGGEDPATGSAAGPVAAWLLKYGALQPEKPAWIEQGVEMGRPSKIFIRGSMNDGVPFNIRVGGTCFNVLNGELEI